MNTSLKFRFVTRTLTEDYRVFGNGGKNLYSDSSEFEPLRKKGRIIPEEGPCAVLYEEEGLIFLTVSAMQRGVKDFANRPIRFSFCEIFKDRPSAWSAFTRIISDFSGAEKIMQSLLHEKPKNNNDGEDVDFRQEEFISWLQESIHSGIRFTPCNEGDVITCEGNSWPCVWPSEGLMLKWNKTEDDQIFCERVNNPQPQRIVYTEQKNSGFRLRTKLFIAVAVVAVVLVIGIYYAVNHAVKHETVQETQAEPQHFDDVTSDDVNVLSEDLQQTTDLQDINISADT